MPAANPISTLPEELLLAVFEHLDHAAPSTVKNRDEPSMGLTTSHADARLLKSITLVSRTWRRIALPLLFRYARLNIDVPPMALWTQGHTTVRRANSDEDDDYDHEERLERARQNETPDGLFQAEFETDEVGHPSRNSYQHTQPFLDFLQIKQLASSVQSFVLLTASLARAADRYPHAQPPSSKRYEAAAGLWTRIFFTIQPTRIAIVAPPPELAFLTGCAVDMFGIEGAWAFSDMDFHILELSIQGQEGGKMERQDLTRYDCIPLEYPGIADGSILNLRPWTHLALNEGSFLKAYGTYEYFERGPPSLIYSIKNCIADPKDSSWGHFNLERLRSLTYTAILPFASHLDFDDFLPHIDELDLQLAPTPNSNILNDKSRVGKAELEDCWQEFFSAYRDITLMFRTHHILPDGTPKLKRFVCRDMVHRPLRMDLDENFIGLCLPVWSEPEPGVFLRLEERPPAYLFQS